MATLSHDDVMGFIKAIDGIANHLTNRANIDVQGWYVPNDANGNAVHYPEDAAVFEIEWVIRRTTGPNAGILLGTALINFTPEDIFNIGYREMTGNARNIAAVAYGTAGY